MLGHQPSVVFPADRDLPERRQSPWLGRGGVSPRGDLGRDDRELRLGFMDVLRTQGSLIYSTPDEVPQSVRDGLPEPVNARLGMTVGRGGPQALLYHSAVRKACKSCMLL